VSGTDLLTVIMDKEPEPAPPVPDSWSPGPEPGARELVADAVRERLVSPYEQLRGFRSALRPSRQLIGQIGEVARGLRSLVGLARPTPLSTLNGPIGPHRRWVWAHSRLDDIKTVRQAHGGTVNDVVLSIITRGFRDLLLGRGEDVDRRVVRTLVPVSVRPVGQTGVYDNQVSAMFAELPVGLDDPLERLQSIRGQMDRLKESKQAVAAGALTQLQGFAPPVLLATGTRLFSRVPQRNVNTVTTNVPGPQYPLYAVGRRLRASIP